MRTLAGAYTYAWKEYGDLYLFHHPITVKQITRVNDNIIHQRAVKSIDEWKNRIYGKAEIFIL